MKLLRRAAPVAAVVILGAAAYAGSLRGEFVFDDLRQIQLNPLVQHLDSYLSSGSGYQAMPNRYVGYLTFALNHRLGGPDVAAFRAVNVAVHLANALLLYALAVLTFRTPRLARSTLAPFARPVAFVAAALFVAHPLQTEAVTYVVQRLTSLATFFYLAAVVLYARWRLALEADPGSAVRRVLGYLPILVAALLAMKTKEIAFTLPFAVLLYELWFFGPPAGRTLAFLAPILATALVIPLTLLDAPALPVVGNATAAPTDRLAPAEYLTTQLTVVPQYLRLLAFPVGQTLDHDHPLYRSPFHPQVALGIAFLLALAGFTVWLHRAAARRPGTDPSVRLVSFGVAWFFLALAVESTVVPLADVMVEHRVYLPAAGFFAAVSTGGALLWRRFAPSRFALPFVVAGAAVAMALGAATVLRNEVWANELSLWADAAAKSPRKPRVHLNLGVAHFERGQVDPAIAEFNEAIALRPDYAEAHTNLGVAYLKKGRRAEAAYEMSLGLRLRASRPSR